MEHGCEHPREKLLVLLQCLVCEQWAENKMSKNEKAGA